jgi:hypothetical protein
VFIHNWKGRPVRSAVIFVVAIAALIGWLMILIPGHGQL